MSNPGEVSVLDHYLDSVQMFVANNFKKQPKNYEYFTHGFLLKERERLTLVIVLNVSLPS